MFDIITDAEVLLDALKSGIQIQVRGKGNTKWWNLSLMQDRVLDMERKEYRIQQMAWVNHYKDAAGTFLSGYFLSADMADFYANPAWTRIGKSSVLKINEYRNFVQTTSVANRTSETPA